MCHCCPLGAAAVDLTGHLRGVTADATAVRTGNLVQLRAAEPGRLRLRIHLGIVDVTQLVPSTAPNR